MIVHDVERHAALFEAAVKRCLERLDAQSIVRVEVSREDYMPMRKAASNSSARLAAPWSRSTPATVWRPASAVSN